MSSIMYHNQFGQRLDIGDIVGWGHRSGNESVQHVGIVLSLDEKTTRGFTETRARCAWVHGPNSPYTSATSADTLFVLDVKTLGSDLYCKIIETAARIVEGATEKATKIAEEQEAREKTDGVSVEA